MKKFIFSLGLSAVFLLVGCQSAVKSARDAGEGHFRARTLIKDKKEAKSFIVNLNFNVQRGKALRMDATSPLNQHLASFLITPKELAYFIVPEKIFYKGNPQPQAFARFMAVPLQPRWLENILFREPFEEKDWLCTQGKSGQLVSCLNKRDKIDITWGESKDRKMTIEVVHSQGEIQMNFHRIQSKVEGDSLLAELRIPKDFRQVR